MNVMIDDKVFFINSTLRSDCKSFSYCDPQHHLIVTGDFRFISNCKLRKLLSNGPYYPENKTINLKIQRALLSKESLSSRYNLTKDKKERIFHLMVKLKFQQTKPIL